MKMHSLGLLCETNLLVTADIFPNKVLLPCQQREGVPHSFYWMQACQYKKQHRWISGPYMVGEHFWWCNTTTFLVFV